MLKMTRIAAVVLLLLFTCHGVYADLLTLYKKGTIKLTPDSEFGKDTDWGELFYDYSKRLMTAPDGTIFVSNGRQHNIFKFSSNGKYTGKFGQKGQGPGDLYRPGDMTILDGKYLVIGEFPSTRRFSLFDLNGKHFKVVKTTQSPYFPTALKNGFIAYMYYKYPNQKTNGAVADLIRHTSVVLKNADSGKEQVLQTIVIPDRTKIPVKMKGGTAAVGMTNFIGQVMMWQTKDGNLLVGASNSPEINIYSGDGKLVRTSRLKMTPIPVTPDYIRKIKAYKVANLRADTGRGAKTSHWMAKQMEKVPFETLFEKHLPYYKKIMTDSQGNILVFKWPGCIGECPIVFQVYSPEGDYICETTIDEGIFDLDISYKSNDISFTDKGIFCLVSLKDSEDVTARIIKVKVPVD